MEFSDRVTGITIEVPLDDDFPAYKDERFTPVFMRNDAFNLKCKEPTSVNVHPNMTQRIRTGVRIKKMPGGVYGSLCPRQSLVQDTGLSLLNTHECFHSRTHSEIELMVRNNCTDTQTIEPNDILAQLILCPRLSIMMEGSKLNEEEKSSVQE